MISRNDIGRDMSDYIYDRDTGQSVAWIDNQEVFRARDGAKIGTVKGGSIYDLDGNLVGHLQGLHVVGFATDTLPVSFKRLIDNA
jgi:hypothetical protein